MEKIYKKMDKSGSGSDKRTIIKPAKKSGIWELISFIYQMILCKDYHLVELKKFVSCIPQIPRGSQDGMQLESCLKKLFETQRKKVIVRKNENKDI